MPRKEEELSTDEMIRNLLENEGGRYVIVGSPAKVQAGLAMIFDLVDRNWIHIEGNDPEDSLHRHTVLKMVHAGARVLEKVPPS